MSAQPVVMETLSENRYLSLPGIGNSALGEVVVNIFELRRYQGVWYVQASLSYNPAEGSIAHQTWYNGEGAGLARILRMQGAPVTLWFPAGARVLEVPGMHELYLEAGRA